MSATQWRLLHDVMPLGATFIADGQWWRLVRKTRSGEMMAMPLVGEDRRARHVHDLLNPGDIVEIATEEWIILWCDRNDETARSTRTSSDGTFVPWFTAERLVDLERRQQEDVSDFA